MSLIAKIHVAAKQLDIEEDDLRSLYKEKTGKTSLRMMSFGERTKVIEELKRKGFKSKSKTPAPSDKYSAKITALWIAAHNLGITRSKTEKSLLAYVKRMANVDHTRFLRHHEDAEKVIESLKKWMTREAGVDWTVEDRSALAFLNDPQGQIVMAQLSIVKDDTLTGGPIRDIYTLAAHYQTTPNNLKSHQWIEIMNELGQAIRNQKNCK